MTTDRSQGLRHLATVSVSRRARHIGAQARRLREELRAERRLGYLFIVTYGRSGSTLLQGILDSTPGYLIRGENRAMMHHLYAYHRTAIAEQERLGGRADTPKHPFYGIRGYDEEIAFRAIRRLALETILRPERDTRVIGFKEIRWDQQPELEQFVKFLCDVFPEARFVVNTRNHEAVSRSKWWVNAENALEKLDKLEKRFLSLADDLGENAFHVHYDDYVADPGVLRDLFHWLGEDFDEQRIREIMKMRHSY